GVPAFFVAEYDNEEGWATSRVLLSDSQPLALILPPAIDEKILRTEFTVSPSALAGTISPLTIPASAGAPLVAATFLDWQGFTYLPQRLTGQLIVGGTEVFLRGDTNLSGGFPDVADAVATLGYLFLQLPLDCLDAADANDDGQIDLADVIYGLSYQFTDGPPPPPPFPLPGLDPTPDGLSCSTPLSAAFPL
ncbi:MAG: hypothetical protein KDC38_19445, partial [Planctomycetes bacterium]|nr:hypothetical protein [Planctomycetota bacterium]